MNGSLKSQNDTAPWGPNIYLLNGIHKVEQVFRKKNNFIAYLTFLTVIAKHMFGKLSKINIFTYTCSTISLIIDN